jgi:CheY-like chemotaxis protein
MIHLNEGNGIPPAELESVFDKLYRVQKGEHVGLSTGLGLAISRGLSRRADPKFAADGAEYARLRRPRSLQRKIALEILAEGPALIILDQSHELLRMIRGRNESVPVVVLSSRGDEARKVHALDLGADDCLTKPFGMDELLARMRAALRHRLQVQGERPVFGPGSLGRSGAPHR